ncbi:MAG: 50S ribosomal protein L18 [Actinobacteria bacterium]|nr:50S ribosomal protein L18 [Actinomycetota bacterium]
MDSTRKHRISRHRRVRKKVVGSAERPRLAVFRSNKHFYAQVIDDASGQTIASASTVDPEIRPSVKGASSGSAARVGQLVAERAMAKGVKAVVFDRGGFRFHGTVKALADSAREKGLEF